MPKTSAELKAQAKEQLKGRWAQIIIAILVVYAVTAIAGIVVIIPIVGFIAYMVGITALYLGLASYAIKFSKYENVEIQEVFIGFKRWLDSFVLYLLVSIFTFLWSLLFLVPGIIKSISYSMSYFILAENPDMKASEALSWSKRITQGHKGRIFYVYLSFIGWSIVATLTLGIGYIWLLPYMLVTMTNLYMDIKELNPEYNTMVNGSSDEPSIYENNNN